MENTFEPINFDAYITSDRKVTTSKIFNIDSFSDEINFTEDDVYYVLNRLTMESAADNLLLESVIFNMLFQKLGGNDKTPVKEVVSLTFMVLNTTSIDFAERCNNMADAIRFNYVLSFLDTMSVTTIPSQFVESIEDMISKSMAQIVLKQYNFAIKSQTLEEFTKFMNFITDNIQYYKKSNEVTSELDSLFSDLNISNN